MGSHTAFLGLLMVASGVRGVFSNDYPWSFQDGPPSGPSDKASCPVTGEYLTISADTPSLDFKNGQKLYFAGQEAMAAYRKDPRAFILSPFESPLATPDGARGLPDLRGTALHCPYSNETINVSMKSLRVDHRYGQAVYFCCHGCLTSFLADPTTAFAGAATLKDALAQKSPKWFQVGPPQGPSDTAFCPVTGASLTISGSTASLDFKNGQKLHFASQDAVEAYRKNPRAFLISTFESPTTTLDDVLGLPDLRGTIVHCPYSNETIEVGMRSMRIDHRYGQAVYVCCHGCFRKFRADPTTAFAEHKAVLVV